MANVALVTEAAKQAARDDLQAYAQAAFGHIAGDWTLHDQVKVYSTPFLDSASNQVATHSLRLQLTHATADAVIICPLVPTVYTGAAGSAPLITVQPSNVVALAGQTSVFAVVAVSYGTVGYQWYKNGVAVTGQTGDQVILINTQTSDAGWYNASVYNSYGTITSSAGTLSFYSSGTLDRDGGAGPGPEEETPL